MKLVDFGCAKHLRPGERTYTVCGTPKYMAPEVIQGQGHGMEADIWSLGICLYRMLERKFPFQPVGKKQANSAEKIFGKILKAEPAFSKGGHSHGFVVVPAQTQDYIRGLLAKEPSSRRGCTGPDGISALKAEPFYEGVPWDDLTQRLASAVPKDRVPAVTDEYDVSNYVEFKFVPNSDERGTSIAAKERFDEELQRAEATVAGFGSESWQQAELDHARALYEHQDYIRAKETIEVATGERDKQTVEGVESVAFQRLFANF